METVKIVFDVDSKDIKTTTDELKALNKITNEEVASLEKLSQSAEDAGDGFISLRTQVKQAKEEAQKAAEKYGEFSKEANAARVKAGALADQMGDLNRQVNLLNPEAKAKAFSNLAQGVVGAFSIATGAVQAFGIKNKEVEAAAQKLQAALNITQGIASLGALKESLQDVKVVLGFTTVAQEALTVATEGEAIASTQAAVATKGFTAALLTNPIFLAVAAIAALAGAMIAMGDDTEEAKTQVDLMTESQKALRAATNASADAADKLAVAQGNLSSAAAATRKAYRDNATDVADLNEKIKENNGKIADNNKIITKNQKALQSYATISKITAEAVAKGAMSEADAESARKSYLGDATKAGLAAIEANKKLVQSNKEITQTIKEKNEATVLNVQTIQEEDKAQNTEKRKQEAKQAASEAKQNAKEREAEAKERLRLADELRKKLQENALAEETDPAKKIEMAKKFAKINYDIDIERLNTNKATQDAIDLRTAEYNGLLKTYSNEEIKLNQEKNAKVLDAEKKFQEALLALQLAKETDPVKRAQIINDAKEKEIDDKLKLVEKGSKEEQTLLLEKEKAEIDAAKRIGEAQVQANKNANDQIKEQDKKAAEDKKAYIDAAVQLAAFAGQTLFEASARQNNEELANLEEQKNKKLINEKQYQAQLRVIKQKQAEDEKKQAIFNATIDLARAIIAALTIPPPGSVVAANFAAILAGANLAKIIATPVPKFQKGTLAVPGIDMGRDSVHAMLQPGEAVIPVSTNKAYHPTIKAIYEKKISPSEINNFVMSRTSSGGRQSLTASVDTYALSRALGKNKTVEVGNAGMIGRAMAKELLRGQNLRRS
jgi:hypothetical protein